MSDKIHSIRNVKVLREQIFQFKYDKVKILKDDIQFKPACCELINCNLDEIDQLSLYVNNKIVNLKEHAKLYLVQKKISKIRNAVSPQPRARVFLHFGLNKQQQEQLIYNLQKNQISNGICKENELTFIDNINERIHKLDNIRPLKEFGRKQTRILSSNNIGDQNFTPIQIQRTIKNRGVSILSKNNSRKINHFPSIHEDFRQNNVQSACKVNLEESMCFSRSTFNSEAHEHRKKILESIIDDSEIKQIKHKIFSQFKNKH